MKKIHFNSLNFEKYINILAKSLLIFCLSFYLLSVFIIQRHSFTNAVFVLGIILLCFLIAVVYKFSSVIKSDKQAIIILTCVSFILLVGWNIIYKVQPSNDYEVLLEGANSIANGTFSQQAARKDDYFSFYNFQIGYAWYLSIFVRLFNNNLIALKFVEIVTIVLTNVISYKILRIFCDTDKSFFGACLLCFNPYIFMGSGVINNQHISALLSILAIYLFLKYKNIYNYILCGVIVTIAQILRPTAVIILIALAICSFISGIVKKDKKALLGALILVAVYFLAMNIINQAFILSGLAPYGIKGDNPYFKLILGLTGTGITGQETTHARYTQLYYDLKYYGFDYDAYKTAASNHLYNLILNDGLNCNWIAEKVVNFAGGVDNQYLYANTEFNNNHILMVGCLNVIGTGLYFISILCSLISALKERNILQNKKYMLYALVFGLYFFAYVIIETQTRYRYEQYYILFLISMPILHSLIKQGKSVKNKIEEKIEDQ